MEGLTLARSRPAAAGGREPARPPTSKGRPTPTFSYYLAQAQLASGRPDAATDRRPAGPGRQSIARTEPASSCASSRLAPASRRATRAMKPRAVQITAIGRIFVTAGTFRRRRLCENAVDAAISWRMFWWASCDCTFALLPTHHTFPPGVPTMSATVFLPSDSFVDRRSADVTGQSAGPRTTPVRQ